MVEACPEVEGLAVVNLDGVAEDSDCWILALTVPVKELDK